MVLNFQAFALLMECLPAIFVYIVHQLMKIINWGIIGCGDVTEIKSSLAFNKELSPRNVAQGKCRFLFLTQLQYANSSGKRKAALH